MTIHKNRTDNTLTLAIEGRLDTTTAPALEAVVKEELDGVTALVFDFTELAYISSAGLRVMLTAQKIMKQQGTMKVTGVNDVVMEVFDITGFSEILSIE